MFKGELVNRKQNHFNVLNKRKPSKTHYLAQGIQVSIKKTMLSRTNKELLQFDNKNQTIQFKNGQRI